jgi:hypothetical protein
MGSNVCAFYAQMHKDGTHAKFAVSPDLQNLATYIPADVNCEAYAAKKLNMLSHGTPGITTRGNSNYCSTSEKSTIDNNILHGFDTINTWLNTELS